MPAPAPKPSGIDFFLKDDPSLRVAALPVAPEKAIPMKRGATPDERLVARVWNDFGGLFQALPDTMGIEPGEMVAVLCAESSGLGFAADGRMMIRFEAHVFHDRWVGQEKERNETFKKTFSFDPSKRWQHQQYHSPGTTTWKRIHADQNSNWEALALARCLDDADALCSTSMGACQIMGFHHAAIGYLSVQAMFAAFSNEKDGTRFQVLGFFDLLQALSRKRPFVKALRQRDFVTFANLYNGPGEAQSYGLRIQKLSEMFSLLTKSLR